MNGNLVEKLECDEFVKSINCYDIILLSETWTNKHSKLQLNGYVKVCKHRKRRKRAKRDSGGLVCFFKHEIWNGITCCPWHFEDGLVFKLDKFYFGFDNNVYLLFPYMRPNSSTRNILDTGVDTFEILADKVSELSNLGEIVIIGD